MSELASNYITNEFIQSFKTRYTDIRKGKVEAVDRAWVILVDEKRYEDQVEFLALVSSCLIADSEARIENNMNQLFLRFHDLFKRCNQ